MMTSWMFCGKRTTTSAAQMSSSASSNTDALPRSGIRGRPPMRRSGLIACVDIAVSVVDADIGGALLAEQPGGTEDHHQQEQDEEEHLPVGGRDVVAAQRLHDADTEAAEQRAFDAAHAA